MKIKSPKTSKDNWEGYKISEEEIETEAHQNDEE